MKYKKQLGGKPPVPDLRVGAFGDRLKENNIDQIIDAPLLIAQGLADDFVLAALNDDWVKQRCAAGQSLEYWTFAKDDHLSIVNEDLSALTRELAQWTKDRFAGLPSPTGCSRKAFD